jgi:hypothetical protein
MPNFSFLHREQAGAHSGFELKGQYSEHHISSGAIRFVIEGDPPAKSDEHEASPPHCTIYGPHPGPQPPPTGGNGKSDKGKSDVEVFNQDFDLEIGDQVTVLANGDLILQMQTIPS